jgi:patatin-like phospholipase/acyl hydrolase
MKRILSIDGGGIRGIIPAVVLAHLENLARKPISELFDLVVGTSTGGILACALTRAGALRRPLYSAHDLVDLYRERGHDVFNGSVWQRISTLGGVLDEMYDHEGLEGVLHHYLGDSLLCDALAPTMVTAYDIERRQTVFFKSWRDRFERITCVQACRATSAAPTYFEPALVDLDNAERALIDGGVFINSPAVSAYAEALKLFPGEEFQMLSLGTGELTRKIPIEDSRTWGKAGWLMPLLSCMFDGMADAADHQMRLFLGDNYQRLQLTLVGASDDMDDASAENIAALEGLAQQLLEDKTEQIATVGGWFVSSKNSHTSQT